MNKVFLVAPLVPSGGPELFHQLGDILNRDVKRAFMLYFCHGGFDKQYDVPYYYEHYHVDSAAKDDVKPGSIVILPESGSCLIDMFPESSVYIWWMSVDGFFEACDKGGLNPEDELDKMRRSVDKHLYQSEYARDFLESEGLNACRLGDRLSDRYFRMRVNPGDRLDLLTHNPMKGYDCTRKILKEMGKRGGNIPELVAITKMYPWQVRDLLEQTKVYIDFGHHPGKDRLPREAAMCGACVITNRRGSAANHIDIPIPDEFKIDDQQEGFEHLVIDKIYEIVNDFDYQQLKFDDYRKTILAESADFEAGVDIVFSE